MNALRADGVPYEFGDFYCRAVGPWLTVRNPARRLMRWLMRPEIRIGPETRPHDHGRLMVICDCPKNWPVVRIERLRVLGVDEQAIPTLCVFHHDDCAWCRNFRAHGVQLLRLSS